MIHKINKVKELPELSPNKEWLAVNKAHLLAEIDGRQRQALAEKVTFVERVNLFTLRATRRMVPSTVKVVSFSFLLAFLFSTGFIAQAAVPGEFLWPIKISIEKAELALATDPVAEAEISLKHANKRLKELEVLATKDIRVDDKQKAISQVIRQLEKNIVSANGNLKLAKTDKNNSNRTVSLAKNLNKSAIETKKVLKEQAKNIGVVIVDGSVISKPAKTTVPEGKPTDVIISDNTGINLEQELARKAADDDVVVVLAEAIKSNEDIADDAFNTVIEITATGKEALTTEEMKELVNGKIADKEVDIQEVEQIISGIDTQEVRNKIFTGEKADITYQEVNKIETSSKESADALNEAKGLLEQGDIAEALAKVKESEDIIEGTVETIVKIDANEEVEVEGIEVIVEQPGTVEAQSVKTGPEVTE